MRSAAHILFSLYYLTMTMGFTLSTCTCWDPFDFTDLTPNTQMASTCCGDSDCSQRCCLKEASTVQLSDDHTSAETRVPAAQNHLSTFSQLEFPSASITLTRFEDRDTGPPQRNSLIQILHCSFLL